MAGGGLKQVYPGLLVSLTPQLEAWQPGLLLHPAPSYCPQDGPQGPPSLKHPLLGPSPAFRLPPFLNSAAGTPEKGGSPRFTVPAAAWGTSQDTQVDPLGLEANLVSDTPEAPRPARPGGTNEWTSRHG